MSSMTVEELATVRRDAEIFLPDTCTIQKKVYVDTDTGSKLTWVNVATVSCRFDSSLPMPEAQFADRVASGAAITVLFPSGTDIRASYRIVAITPLVATLEVVTVEAPKSYEITRRVVCRQVL